MRELVVLLCLGLPFSWGCSDKGGDTGGDFGDGQPGDDGSGDDGADGGNSGDGDDTADDGSDGDTGGGADGSGDTGDDGGDDGGSFIQEPDGGGSDKECDIWSQDCPDGEKCMPWANDGGGAWNATKCSPIDPSPKQPGDACTVEGNGVSGIDDCEVAAMCWDVDPETSMGTCVAFCGGSADAPVCDDPDTVCLITNEGVLILCLPICDPILQDCADGQACYLVDGVTITCGPDSSGTSGLFGDPCEYDNACDPGLFCAPSDKVPGCAGGYGCCSNWCDASDPNASMGCGGFSQGQECQAFFDPGDAPPGYEDVGVCVIP